MQAAAADTIETLVNQWRNRIGTDAVIEILDDIIGRLEESREIIREKEKGAA
jgi:hypothetical protein